MVDKKTEIAELSRSQLEQEIAQLRLTVERLQATSGSDSISGLLMRAPFLERANAEYMRSRRYGKDMTLVVINMLDFGKMVQDIGPEAADCYVTGLAQMCESACRAGSDILGRISENKFAILLPEADMSGCNIFKERLKRELSGSKMEWEGQALKSGLKLSAGTLMDEDQSFKDLYLRTVKQYVGPYEPKQAASA